MDALRISRSRVIPSRRRVVVYVVALLGILLLRLVLDVWTGAHLRAVSDRIAPEYGGRLDVASLSPPAVAPEENRARIVSAAAALTTLGRTGVLQELMLALLRGVPYASEREGILRQAVEGNRLALAVFDEIRSRPKANWEISYDDGPRRRLPSLLEFRDLSSVNAAAGQLALRDGDDAEAARRAGLGMTLAGSLGLEPDLLVQLIHIAAAGVQVRLVRNLLAAGEPPAEALELLAASIEQERAYDPAVTGLIGQLKLFNSMFDGWERGGAPWSSQQDAGGILAPALQWLIRPGTQAAHARALEDLHRTIQYARLRPFERTARHLLLPLDEPQPWWWRKLAPMFFSGIDRSIRSGDEHRAIMTLASTAVALRRCRLERGSYPESLEELAPVFLPDVPVDPYTGREPDYSRLGTGFTLKVASPPGPQDQFGELLNWSIPR